MPPPSSTRPTCKSVTVLKGAAAAALYGSRAANGVIQITTKSGARTQGIGVTINTSAMASQVYGLPDYQNEFGGGGYGPFLTLDGDFIKSGPEDQFVVDYATDQSWGPRLDGRPVRQWYSWDEVNGLLGQSTPWVAHPGNVENFFQTGLAFNTTVSLSQAGENFNYRLSLANIEQTGVYPNAHLGRKQIGVNGSVDLTEDFRATVIGNYVDVDAKGRPGTGYDNENVFLQFNHFGQRQIALGPDSYMRDYTRTAIGPTAQRAWNWFGVAGAKQGVLLYTDNPYWVRYENYQSDDTERLFGKVQLAYDFAESLTLSANVGTDFYTERRQDRVATGSQALDDYDEAIFEVQETSVEMRLTYDGQLSEDFGLNVFGATKYRYESFSNNFGSTNGGLGAPNIFTVENSLKRPTITDYFQEKGVISLYGAANLGWRDLIYLGLTARNDWSSTLPEGQNSYFYPSASLSFVFSSLPALSGSNVLSFGKLRLSAARVGSDTNPYRLKLTYPINTPFSAKPTLSLPNTLNNPVLKPEITTSYEVGTQLQFFNNRVGLDATYYYSSTRNQILAVDVSRASGYSGTLVNAGEITNQGLELSLSVTPLLTQDFQWDITANWAKNVNEVVELFGDLKAFTIGGLPFGPAVQARVGHPYGVFYGTDFVYGDKGNIVLNGFGWPLASDFKVIGNYQPDWTGGLSSTFSYKGFSASILLSGQKGGDIYSLSNVWGIYSGMFEETVDGHVRALGVIPEGVWDAPGDGTDALVPFDKRIDPNLYFAAFYTGPKAMVIYDASYIKLQELSIGYSLPQTWLLGTPIRSLTVLALGRNLATLLKNTPNFDAATAISSSNVQGFEAGQIPPQRSYGLSLRMSL